MTETQSQPITYEDLVVLIPSHGLEDFPTELEEDQAASLLNGFAVIWHPLLLTAARVLPSWHRSDSPPEPLNKRLIIVPLPSETWVQGGWMERARIEGASVVHGLSKREEMIEAALAPLELDVTIDPDLVADFYALGSAYLQIELLTRKMHYFSNIDQVNFQREILAAADAAVADDPEAARVHLGNCFESLQEARERFYPVECYLIDLCLLIPRLADANLEKLLTEETPFNLLATAAHFDDIATDRADLISTIRERWHDGQLNVIGGEYRELPTPQVPLESTIHEFRRGHDIFQRLFGRTPKTWGRRRFGLSPLMPQILTKHGYHSALHLLLDDGLYPDAEQSKIRWEGCDGTIVDAITRIPLAADGAASFLRFSTRMAESMQEDQVAAIIFARWPELRGPWFEDFRRMQRYAPVLGRFVTFADFFEQTEDPGRLSNHSAGEYLSPFLVQGVARVEANPISRFTAHTLRRRDFDSAIWFRHVAEILRGRPVPDEATTQDERCLESGAPEASDEFINAAEAMLDRVVPESASQLAELLCAGAKRQPGLLLLNPLSFARTVSVDLAEFQYAPEVADPVKAVQFDERRKSAVVSLPPCGYAYIAAPTAPPAKAPSRRSPASAPLAEGTMLRNEFFEVYINESTGGIGGVKNYGRSSNRLSQQVSYRFRHRRVVPVEDGGQAGEEKSYYAEMRCTGIEVTSSGPTVGEIVTIGEIVDQAENTRLAGFRQTTRVWRGRPVVEVDLEIEPNVMPDRDPWTNYYAVRFAWNDITAALTRSVQGMAQPFKGERFESADYLEIASDDQRTTILNLGLPFHRKTSDRMVDTLLIVAGETQRRFHFAIAVDADYPLQAALDAITPVAAVSTQTGPPASGPSSWLFHLDARNVQITRIMGLVEETSEKERDWDDQEQEPTANETGFALRLVETEGRFKRVRLTSFRTPARARQRDFQGSTLTDLPIEDEAVIIDVAAYEIVDVELRFA